MPADKSFKGGEEAVMSIVAPGTFAALGVPIRAGRDFSAADREGAPKVAIINETIARAAFRGQDPIGRVIHCTYDSLDPMTIVGVVGNVRQYGPAVQPSAECFMPHLQHFYNNTTLSVLVRTAGDPGNLPETVQRLARRRGPDASVRMTSMDAILAERVAAPRFRALLLGLFAGIALCLSMAGVYGVMAWTVAQRATEIGVRMALGATARSVLWLMVRRGMWLVGAGLALGLIRRGRRDAPARRHALRRHPRRRGHARRRPRAPRGDIAGRDLRAGTPIDQHRSARHAAPAISDDRFTPAPHPRRLLRATAANTHADCASSTCRTTCPSCLSVNGF